LLLDDDLGDPFGCQAVAAIGLLRARAAHRRTLTITVRG
jgi:hypothetical protein